MKDTVFPENFLWGASTSAYQVEGAAFEDGKRASQQDIIHQESYDQFGFANADIASDHYHHYKEDVAWMKQMGFTAYRFSIAWSRVFPAGRGEVNRKGMQFYENLIDELKKNGIEPIITLYHYDLPWALVEEYDGWIDRRVVDDFENYARYVIHAFKEKVRYWTTINEQSIIVQYWTQKCYIPEKYLHNDRMRFQINHHMNLAHATACKLVHELVPGGLAGAAIGYAPVYPLTGSPEDAMAALNAHELKNAYYLDIYFKGIYNQAGFSYLKENGLAPEMKEGDMELIKEGYSDFLAINYYASECACAPQKGEARRFAGVNRSGVKGKIDGFETQPGFYKICRNPNLDTTDWDWAIDPVGLEYLLRDIYSRYNKPLMITENGLGAYDTMEEDKSIHDPYRIEYLKEHIKSMKQAIDQGVEVIAYCPWSAIDLLSTSNGMKKRYGLIYVDRTDDDPKECKRYRKDSSYWYEKVIRSNGGYLTEEP
ncbi:glycoside hydrolase family 1 protein [Lachnospiraceae bacterium 54-53]